MGRRWVIDRTIRIFLATAINAPNSFSYATTLRLGLPAAVQPDFSSGRVDLPRTAGVFTLDNRNYVRGYVQSWNFTIEQRVKGWTASAGYVASRAVDPIAALNLNWSPIGTGTAGQILNVLVGLAGFVDSPFGKGKQWFRAARGGGAGRVADQCNRHSSERHAVHCHCLKHNLERGRFDPVCGLRQHTSPTRQHLSVV